MAAFGKRMMIDQGKFIAHHGHAPVDTSRRTNTGLKSGCDMSVCGFFNIVITDEFSELVICQGGADGYIEGLCKCDHNSTGRTEPYMLMLVVPCPDAEPPFVPNGLPEYTHKMPDQRFTGVIYLKAFPGTLH